MSDLPAESPSIGTGRRFGGTRQVKRVRRYFSMDPRLMFSAIFRINLWISQ
jgi:hypothetical protein